MLSNNSYFVASSFPTIIQHNVMGLWYLYHHVFTFTSVILQVRFVLSRKFVPYTGMAEHSLVSTSQVPFLATPVTTGGAARSIEQSKDENPSWQWHTPIIANDYYSNYYYSKTHMA